MDSTISELIRFVGEVLKSSRIKARVSLQQARPFVYATEDPVVIIVARRKQTGDRKRKDGAASVRFPIIMEMWKSPYKWPVCFCPACG
jgi:hypothetical protein